MNEGSLSRHPIKTGQEELQAETEKPTGVWSSSNISEVWDGMESKGCMFAIDPTTFLNTQMSLEDGIVIKADTNYKGHNQIFTG